MKAIFTLLLSFSLCSLGQSNADLHDLEKAGTLYQNGQYSDALYYLERIPDNSKIRAKSYRLRSLCYANMGDYEMALQQSQKTLQYDSENETKLLHLENLIRCEHYEVAAQFLKDEKVNVSLSHTNTILDSAITWKKKPTVRIHNHSSNSASSDISAIEYQKSLLFSSNREGVFIKRKNQTDGEPFYNFLITTAASGKTHLFSEKINSGEHDFAPSLTAKEDTLYFTRRKTGVANNKPYYYFKLYCSEKKEGKWTPAYQFILNDSTHSYAYPFLDEKNNIFYFASDMPGGYGGWDLYICIRKDSLWSEPINLGPEINTNKNEIYDILFFSSNGHFSLGGFDIFKTSFQKGKWCTPQNLKMPINSGADDIAISFSSNHKKAWFVSNRPGGKGQEDIYEIDNPEFLTEK
jgi:tetratricopeptide (TPR) repeat protein